MPRYHVTILERRHFVVEVDAADEASAERAAKYNLAHLARIGEPKNVDCEPVWVEMQNAIGDP